MFSERVAAIAISSLCLSAQAWGAPNQTRGPAEFVFIVMLDGVRQDALRTAQVPTLRRLATEGVEYLQATTVYPSQTRVAFVSLPTGAYPGTHGIVGGDDIKDEEWRTIPMGDDDPFAAQTLVACPTMFEDAARAGLTSLYAAMKGYELVGARGATWTINGKLTIGRSAYQTRYQSDVAGSADLAAGYKQLLSRELLDQALEIVRSKRPNLVVLNLGSADYAAHSFGPASERYRGAIEYLDSLVDGLLRSLEAVGIRERSAIIVAADHGFSEVDPSRVVAAVARHEDHTIPALAAAGLEHYVVNTGGSSMGIYIRDKRRLPEAVSLLRAQPWCEAVYCENASAACDRTLQSLHDYFAGRSPDLMVDLDDDATLQFPEPGQHGSLRPDDMRIPLILWGAGIARHSVLGKASLVDVAPTALRLLGVTPKLMRLDGRPLVEALAAVEGSQR